MHVIYKIHCNITGEDYYGSSCNFVSRMSSHLTNTEKQNSKRKCTSASIIARNDFTSSIVEECAENNKTFALWRERYYIETFPCVNADIPIRTKEEKRAMKKQYQEDNREHIRAIKLKYSNAHRQESQARSSARYAVKKAEINKAIRENIYDCECGKLGIRWVSKSRHNKTTRHQEYLAVN